MSTNPPVAAQAGNDPLTAAVLPAAPSSSRPGSRINLGNVFNAITHGDDDLDAIALIGLDAAMHERRITFAEFDKLVQAVASGLRHQHMQRGDHIAILAANSIDYLATFLGIMRAGGVAVPVNFKFPPQTIDYVLRDAGVTHVFCDAARRAAVPVDFPAIVFDEHAADGDGRAESALPAIAFHSFLHAGAFDAIIPAPGETAMLLYTSGSTGKPKGVRLSHESHGWVVRTRLSAAALSGDRILIAAPLYHMNALALALLTLTARATTVLLPQFDARRYIEAITRYRCTWLTAVPPMIAMMLREQASLAAADLSSVRVIRMGSAPVSESLLEKTRQLLPNARIINAYGTTEGGPVVFGPHPKGLSTPSMAIGHPHPLVQLRLVDKDGRHGPAVREGVLHMKSPGVMSGYHQRPDLTHPISDDGYYVTGDVFRRDDDDFYYFVGRHDDMFVSGGENIYPGEVEKLLEQHASVQQAIVVPVPDEIKGTKPVAFVVPAAGVRADAEELKRFALANAPAYQHPRHIWFLDALPLASTNKIDRRALLDDAVRRLP